MANDLALTNVNLDMIQDSLSNITNQHKDIGKIETPKGLVKKKMGFDYVELSYMKKIANEQFPGWSWTIIKSEALGVAAYVVHGRLKWLDNGLWRDGDMVAAHRIQTKRGSTEFVEIGNDIKSANTDCMKKAFNVYMDIAADVYRSDDPTLDDEQIDKIKSVALKVSEEQYNKAVIFIEDGTINTGNYKGTIAKLERMAKSG
jgi:hypothetical protein|tara:strand:+ start:3270 stop:3875 length:606 start_codon:yes stop_codon:yes gene_type:complete